MTRRTVSAAVIILLLATGVVTPAIAQGDTVSLVLRLRGGDVVYYDLAGSSQTSFEIATTRQSAEARLQGREVHRVLEADAAGVLLIEAVIEEMRVTIDGRTEESIDEPIVMRVQPSGKVVEARPHQMDDFPIALPDRPVAVNDSWSRESRIEEAGVIGRGTTTYTLASVEATAGDRVARIRIRTDGTVSSTGGIPLPPGVQGQARGSVRGSGEVEWSIDQGRMLRASADTTIDVQLEVTGQGQTLRGRLLTRTQTTHTPLAAGSIPAPVVSPEFLVTPGRSIGAIALDLTVADANTRLGNSTPRDSGALYLAPSVVWLPNRMAGFLDPSDPTRLIGLETGDRRHSTEKGIGFGSSEGAVLIAYGMSPIKIDMTIANLGGARMLIYNDQGIAVAITTDARHARAGPDHAPIGAVDWIDVFPPGAASKIFRMP